MSCVVLALPSALALLMAVTGRHSAKLYLASQQAIAASASATLSCAISRALADRLLPCAAATCAAIATQCPGGVKLPPPSAQKRACWVWSAVRVPPVALPSKRTSSTACA